MQLNLIDETPVFNTHWKKPNLNSRNLNNTERRELDRYVKLTEMSKTMTNMTSHVQKKAVTMSLDFLRKRDSKLHNKQIICAALFVISKREMCITTEECLQTFKTLKVKPKHVIKLSKELSSALGEKSQMQMLCKPKDN